MNKQLHIVFCFIVLIYFANCAEFEDKDDSWDIFLFVQAWLPTSCLLWEQMKPNATCVYPTPTNHNSWILHGVWPSKIGEKDGPNFCNKTLKFNFDLLQPIINDLELNWPNIRKGTPLTDLWKHEWLKHGSCSASLPQFDSELNYFNQSLVWLNEFNMTQILSNKNIVPNKNVGYNVTQIHQAILETTGMSPMIQCVNEKGTKKSLLSDIRLCFNKTLDFIDCSIYEPGHKDKDLLTNCVIHKPVYYIDSNSTKNNEINSHEVQNIDYVSRHNKLIRIHKILQFLMWVTL